MKSPLRFSMKLTIRTFVLAVLAATVLMSVGANAGIVPELTTSVGCLGFYCVSASDPYTGSGYGDFTPDAPFGFSFRAGSDLKVTVTEIILEGYDEVDVASVWGPAGTITVWGPGGLTLSGRTYGGGSGTGQFFPDYPNLVFESTQTGFAGRWSNGLWAFGTASALYNGASHGDYDYEAFLTITTYSPEPGTALLITGGVALLGFWKRRLIG